MRLAIPVILLTIFSMNNLMALGTDLVKLVDSCKKVSAKKTIYIVKQWHLSPATNSFKNQDQKLPQTENQKAIYSQLAQWIDEKKLDTVVGEGCEGPINKSFAKEFNGWNFNSLKAKVADPLYADYPTHVPLKLEVRYGDSLQALCGDNEKLVTEGAMRLSNLRGLTGYFTRINQFRTKPDQVKSYAESAAQLLKMPKDSSLGSILTELKTAVDAEIHAFLVSIANRNKSFVDAVDRSSGINYAIVIGGLHAIDLKNKIEDKGWNCEVLEPKGYSEIEEHVIEDLKKALEKG